MCMILLVIHLDQTYTSGSNIGTIVVFSFPLPKIMFALQFSISKSVSWLRTHVIRRASSLSLLNTGTFEDAYQLEVWGCEAQRDFKYSSHLSRLMLPLSFSIPSPSLVASRKHQNFPNFLFKFRKQLQFCPAKCLWALHHRASGGPLDFDNAHSYKVYLHCPPV